MTRRTYTPEYKAKLVIEVLQGEKELNTIAAENSISPNMLRNWKAEFLENAGRAFERQSAGKGSSQKGGRPEEDAGSDAQDHWSADPGARFSSGLLSRGWTSNPQASFRRPVSSRSGGSVS